jgi:hypothetical protein
MTFWLAWLYIWGTLIVRSYLIELRSTPYGTFSLAATFVVALMWPVVVPIIAIAIWIYRGVFGQPSLDR